MALPTALIQSSFSLSESATKNIASSAVESSKAWGLLMASSAPLIERQRWTSMTPRGIDSCVVVVVLLEEKKETRC